MMIPIDALTGQRLTVAPWELAGTRVIVMVPANWLACQFHLPHGLLEDIAGNSCYTQGPPHELHAHMLHAHTALLMSHSARHTPASACVADNERV